MKENKGAGRPVEFKSIAKRDRDRLAYKETHPTKRQMRFISPVSGNSAKSGFGK